THFDVNQVIAGEIPAFHGIVNALFGRLDELARNCAAFDLAREHKAFAGRRLNLELDARVLSAATGLLLENSYSGSRLRNAFAIGHLGLAHVGFNAELA